MVGKPGAVCHARQEVRKVLMTREKLVALLCSGLDAGPEFIGGGVLLCHTPAIAPLAYLHRIYPVLTPEDFDALESHVGRPVPPDYSDFLHRVGNGARLFELSLHGFVGQLRRVATDPLGQPVSLRYGNVVERPRGLDDDTFAIGAMVGWSSRGSLIMEPSGEVLLVHPVDGQDVAARWPDLETMLESEISRRSSLYDRAGRRLVSATDAMHPGGRKWETKAEPRLH
jgi:hypothetical protein